MKRQQNVRRELDSVIRYADMIKAQAIALRREYAEAEDAGLLSLRSNTGGAIPTKGSVSNQTAASAGSYEFQRIQGARRHMGFKVTQALKHMSGGLANLGEASRTLHGAWLDTDPELGPDRRRRRKEAAEAASEQVAANG